MKRILLKRRSALLFALFLILNVHSYAQLEDLQVGSVTRKMLAYAPSSITDNSPLLISMHGLNQDVAYQRNQTKWETLADEKNFVVVFPSGINKSWDLSGTNDIDFILAIIDEMYSRYKIDRDRVYLSGFSMGGMMTYHAATRIADKIAAFAPVSGYLMGGPNTNSSRPIPIIHTHGTADDVVPYSGVSTCLDAWVERNGCPQTPDVTAPYPADKPNSSGTKTHWGKGIDDVEIVLLSLAGKGHWHSNDDNGVHTSREIWDFCKNYSLKMGVPTLVSAAVTEANPKRVKAVFSKSIKSADSFDGFSVKVDMQDVTIDNVALADTNVLNITLATDILKSNDILLSYGQGNVLSVFEKELEAFNDFIVENYLAGSAPRIVELSTNFGGDTLFAHFNKKMNLPADVSTLAVNAQFNGSQSISIDKSSFVDEDQTVIAFSLSEKVYADYGLTVSYTGNAIVSEDNGALKTFSAAPITNKSKGLPVTIETITMEADGSTLSMKFSKDIDMVSNQLSQLVLKVDGQRVGFLSLAVSEATAKVILHGNMHHGDQAEVSYTPGNITAADKGELEAFANFNVVNNIAEPTWHPIPGKIEAENYALQLGTDTETVSDNGGGLNIGWTDPNDWLDYAIENSTTGTNFHITFRVAAAAADKSFDYYIDDVKVGSVTVPNTGGWQNWESVSQEITLSSGKHYFKVVSVTGGFNINYFSLDGVTSVGGNDIKTRNKIKIFPNPTSSNIVIQSPDFKFNNVEVFDTLGHAVLQLRPKNVSELNLSINLDNGIYTVKISNDKVSHSKRIVVKKD